LFSGTRVTKICVTGHLLTRWELQKRQVWRALRELDAVSGTGAEEFAHSVFLLRIVASDLRRHTKERTFRVPCEPQKVLVVELLQLYPECRAPESGAVLTTSPDHKGDLLPFRYRHSTYSSRQDQLPYRRWFVQVNCRQLAIRRKAERSVVPRKDDRSSVGHVWQQVIVG